MRVKLLCLTILLTIIGTAAFVLCLVYEIYAAAYWNIITGFINFLTTHIIFLKLRHRLSQWYGLSGLECITKLAFCFMGISVIGTIYHIAYLCMSPYLYKYVELGVTISLWLPIVCAFGTSLSALLLCIYVKRERKCFASRAHNNETQHSAETSYL